MYILPHAYYTLDACTLQINKIKNSNLSAIQEKQSSSDRVMILVIFILFAVKARIFPTRILP